MASFPFVYALDHVGPFARSTADLAAAYDALQGIGPGGQPPGAAAGGAVTPVLGAGLGGLRVARLGGWFGRMQSAAARGAVEAVAAGLGATRMVDMGPGRGLPLQPPS